MTAKLKCSSCGAELDKVTFSSGGKPWLFALLAFIPVVWLFWRFSDNNDFERDLEMRSVQKQISNGTLTLVGSLHNSGRRRWEHPTIEAEFYSETGQFLGERSERMDGSVAANSDENFSLSFESIPEQFVPDKGEVKIKISDAFSRAF